jgi:tetratricopeptide (TPR) repeat protein
MSRRIIPISSYPVCLTVAIIAITLIVIGQAGAVTTDIEQAKTQIVSLINSGNISEADASINKFIADEPISSEKGKALQQIAGTYQNAGQVDKAIKLCDYIFQNWPKDDFAVWAGMSMTLAQLDKGDITAAESTIQKMIVDYAGNEGLSPALWVIADTYSWHKMYERAGRIYIIIAEKFPDSTWAARATEGIKGMEILRLIENTDFSIAKEKTDSMIAEFSSEPNLSDMLLRIGQEISWRRQYGDSKYVLDRLIELYPQSLAVNKAKLWSARAAACELIKDKNNDDALNVIDKMISDFDGQPDLADSVQWISKECEWTNGESFGKADRYDTARLIYQRLQKFSNPDVAKQAEWNAQRMAYRTKILTLMDKGDENEIDTTIDQMAVDLAGRPELANDLFWIASWYDEQYHKPTKGMALYERIAIEFPDSNESKESIGRVINIANEIEEKTGAEGVVDSLVARLKQRLQRTNSLANVLQRLGGTYYIKGLEKEQNGLDNEATQLFKKAISVWEDVIGQFPNSVAATRAKYLCGDCYVHLGQCENALPYLNDVLAGSDDNVYANAVRQRIEQCKNGLKE